MKKIFTLVTFLGLAFNSKGQEIYRDFETINKVVLGQYNGVMDSTAANTFTNLINISTTCAKYIRDTAFYDNFKMFPLNKLVDVAPYASNAIGTPKLKLKLYSTAAPGTTIQLQLGSKTNTSYPAGVHSQYTAVTSISHAWEQITFNYQLTPIGGFTTSTEINKIVILFHPNTTARDTIYFDDVTGPEVIPVGLREMTNSSQFKLYQNIPNPAKESTSIKLQLNTSGHVSLILYDILGKKVSVLADQNMAEGVHNIFVETANIPDGIYFYVLKKEGTTQSIKMVVSK